MDVVKFREGSPHSFGWMRTPDMDIPGHRAWEMPNGVIVVVPADCNTIRIATTPDGMFPVATACRP